jgi:hypothetical protein
VFSHSNVRRFRRQDLVTSLAWDFAMHRVTQRGRGVVASYLEKARHREPFDASLYDEDDDPEEIEMERQLDIREAANDLLLVERAKEWLLGDED